MNCSRKPAPIQVTAWGHGTGTGLKTIDYMFTDPVAIPADVRHLFAETLYDLPCLGGYDPPERTPPVAALPMLENEWVSFGCFNRISKISDAAFALWARLLAAAPGSRLVLKDVRLSEPEMQSLVRQHFADHGIGADRLVLLPGTPHFEHLAAYGQVDIALDPFPASGGATTFEALWMGVPVVTLPHPSCAGRNTAAIDSAIGHPEWIAQSEDDYIAIAQRLASDPETLANIRAELRGQMVASSVADPQAYCRAAEAAYRSMWRTYCTNGARG